jgi:hypothetical protein
MVGVQFQDKIIKSFQKNDTFYTNVNTFINIFNNVYGYK